MTRGKAMQIISEAWARWQEQDGIGQGEWGGQAPQTIEDRTRDMSDDEIIEEAERIQAMGEVR